MNHIIREYAGRKIELFLNVSPSKIMDILLSLFKVSSLYMAIKQPSFYPQNGIFMEKKIIFCLKMMVKSGLEKFTLKSLHMGK